MEWLSTGNSLFAQPANDKLLAEVCSIPRIPTYIYVLIVRGFDNPFVRRVLWICGELVQNIGSYSRVFLRVCGFCVRIGCRGDANTAVMEADIRPKESVDLAPAQPEKKSEQEDFKRLRTDGAQLCVGCIDQPDIKLARISTWFIGTDNESMKWPLLSKLDFRTVQVLCGEVRPSVAEQADDSIFPRFQPNRMTVYFFLSFSRQMLQPRASNTARGI